MSNLLIGLFLGMLLGIFINKYLFVYLDWIVEDFIARISESITEHNLNISMMSCEVTREYPELSNNPDNAGQTNVIGFQCYGENDEVYEDEDRLNKNMGKRKVNR